MLQCALETSGPPAPISRLALSGCPSGSQVVWVCALECNVNIAFPHSRFGVQCRYHRHVAQRCAVVWGVGISSLRDLVGSGHQAWALTCGTTVCSCLGGLGICSLHVLVGSGHQARCPLAAPCEAQGHRSQEKSCSWKCRAAAKCRGTMPCCGTMPR